MLTRNIILPQTFHSSTCSTEITICQFQWENLCCQFVVYIISWLLYIHLGPLCSYCSLIYKYLRNQCLSPLQLWIRNPFVAMCTRSNIMLKSLSVTCDRTVFFFRVLRFPPPITLTATISMEYCWKWR